MGFLLAAVQLFAVYLVTIHTTLRLKQRKLWSGFFVLARKVPAGLLAASQRDLTQPGRKRPPQNRWFRLRGVSKGLDAARTEKTPTESLV